MTVEELAALSVVAAVLSCCAGTSEAEAPRIAPSPAVTPDRAQATPIGAENAQFEPRPTQNAPPTKAATAGRGSPQAAATAVLLKAEPAGSGASAGAEAGAPSPSPPAAAGTTAPTPANGGNHGSGKVAAESGGDTWEAGDDGGEEAAADDAELAAILAAAEARGQAGAAPAAKEPAQPDPKAAAKARRFILRARIMYGKGEYDKAELVLKEAITMYPFFAEANLLLGKIFLIRGSATRDRTMINSARLMFEMARALDPTLREPAVLLELFMAAPPE